MSWRERGTTSNIADSQFNQQPVQSAHKLWDIKQALQKRADLTGEPQENLLTPIRITRQLQIQNNPQEGLSNADKKKKDRRKQKKKRRG